MSDADLELLARYVRDNAEEAFAEIVRRHLNLVHSAALRQVRSPQLAEEVAQATFLKLARHARQLAPDTILTAWLYQVTRREAIDVVRREARRQLREQIATEMNAMNATGADWMHIEPLLDEAVSALDETDRAAVLLRYFENKSLREVGQQLNVSDDAAQKRVSRAVERLREFFAKRGVTVGAGGLTVVISANAVQAAPAGLAAAISTAATLTGTTLATAATVTATKAIAMTTLQKTLITATVAVLAGAGIYEARQTAQLREQNQILRQQQQTRDDSDRQRWSNPADQSVDDSKGAEALRLRAQVQSLRDELEQATNRTSRLRSENEDFQKVQNEARELREQVVELTKKTNQLFASLSYYINSYSNSIPSEKRWAYSLSERARFSLAQSESGGYFLRRKGADGTERDWYGGNFTSIGIDENHVFVRSPAFKDEGEGWRIIDLRDGAVNGPYTDAEFMSRPEVQNVRFMKPEEAWELMK